MKVRDDCGSRGTEQEGAEELADELPRLQAKAKASSKGLWAGGDRLQTSLEVSDAKGFVGEWKGKSLNGIVEKVLTGDRMIVRLLLSPTRHIQTLLLVAGIRTPSTKRTNVTDGKEVPGEPFGEEAFEFIDEKMLQRNVVVDIVGQSNTGQLIATIKHPANGNIAPFLLEAGLARCHDHHSTMLGGEMAALRAAEKKAKEKNLGVFRGQVVKRSAGVDIESVVTRVQSADTIYVSSRSQSGAEKRVSLSSIRAPKTTDPKQSQYIADAKEFLRKKLIGKHVKVAVDGKKAASDGFEEKEVVTVTMHGGKNAALVVVEAGYASVIRHRRDDGTNLIFHNLFLFTHSVSVVSPIMCPRPYAVVFWWFVSFTNPWGWTDADYFRLLRRTREPAKFAYDRIKAKRWSFRGFVLFLVFHYLLQTAFRTRHGKSNS